MIRSVKIEPGVSFKVRALSWDDGWEFDCPVVIIDPVLRVYEDGRGLDQAIEDLCIDACIYGVLQDHNAWRWDDAPGGSLGYLRRKYHRKNTNRMQALVTFRSGAHRELEFDFKETTPMGGTDGTT